MTRNIFYDENIKVILKLKKFFLVSRCSYHQKYRLQSHLWLVEAVGLTGGEELIRSTLAAKLNGYIAGAGTLEQFYQELPSLGLGDNEAEYLEKRVIENQGNGLYC